ncbi:MAG TPA: restriction endonuclease [Bradyrhizobium sp.]|nr:restriction endonuclease [Bradyrhizobium sp.]
MATLPSTKRIGDKFELLVSTYYEALGYKVTRDVRIGGHQIDLIVSKQISGAGLFTIMVEAKSRTATVGINEITPFLNTASDLLRAGTIQQAICITDKKFSQDARSAVFGKGWLRLSTIYDLENDLFNYSESLLKIVHDYQSKPIFHDFLKLEGLRRGRREATVVSDVASFILDWCNSGESLLILCGDFGSGKTTVLDHVHYQQAKLRIERQDAFLPLSFRLRGLLQSPDLWTFISTSLRESNHISPTRQVFETQLAAGKLLILLDGFDEIETGAIAIERAAHLKRLAPLISSLSPCVVSTRPTYFESFDEMSEALTRNLGKTPKFEGLDAIKRDIPALLRTLGIVNRHTVPSEALSNVLSISQLSYAKISEYLQKHETELNQKTKLSSAKIKEFLYRIYDLEDLMTRPLLLQMVVATILQGTVRVSQTKSIGPATLYNLYTQFCATRVVESRSKQFLSMKERLLACCEIALVMLKEKKIILTAREVLVAISRARLPSVIASLGTSSSPHEHAFADIRVCSFLSFGDDDSLKFGHKSYSEFFVAQWLVANTAEGTKNWIGRFNEFSEDPIGREIIYFLGSFARDNQYFGRLVDSAIRRGKEVRPSTNALARRIAFASGKLLDRLSLAGGAIEEADLRKVAVERAFLRNVKFSKVSIRDLHASKWQLRGCEFKEVSVANSEFSDSAISLVLEDSHLDACSFQDGSIKLAGAKWSLRESTLTGLVSRFGGSGWLHKVNICDSQFTIGSDLDLQSGSDIRLRRCVVVGEMRKIKESRERRGALTDDNWYRADSRLLFHECTLLGVSLGAVTLVNLFKDPLSVVFTDCRGLVFFTDPHKMLAADQLADIGARLPGMMFCNRFHLKDAVESFKAKKSPSKQKGSEEADRVHRMMLNEVAAQLKAIKLPEKLESPLSEIAAAIEKGDLPCVLN